MRYTTPETPTPRWIPQGCLLAAAAAAVLVACAPSTPPTTTASNSASPGRTPQQYTMQDFYANTSYNGASWSSDRKHILVSSNATGIWNVYAIPAAGGAPVPLTQSTTQSIFARAKVKASFEGWAGDDKSFFVSTNERDERYFDLYVRLHRVSPLFNAEKIKVPLMVLQGANDPRVLKVESEEIVAAARKNGVPVEYVIFPDEGHGFVKKENPIRGYSAVIQFLDRYLKGAAE